MAKSISKFIVSLKDESHFKPKFVVSVVPQKEDPELFLVRIIHPNSNDPNEIKDKNSAEAKALAKDPVAKAAAFAKKIVYSKLIRAKSFSEAMIEGKKMLELPEILMIETTYEEKKHIPQPRRGKMKLKTKEEFEKEQEELLMEGAEESDDEDSIEDMEELEIPVKNNKLKEVAVETKLKVEDAKEVIKKIEKKVPKVNKNKVKKSVVKNKKVKDKKEQKKKVKKKVVKKAKNKKKK